MTEDRIEVILVTAMSPPMHRASTVNSKELEKVVDDFRTALSSRDGKVKEPAAKLYEWIVKPFRKQLEQAKAETTKAGNSKDS